MRSKLCHKEALPQDRAQFRLSLVHVLWLGGLSLVVFALWLLALELSRGDAYRMIWVCGVYALGLLAVNWAVSSRPSLRLLSSILEFGIGLCLFFAVLSWQDAVGGPEFFRDWSSLPNWSREDADPAPIFHYHPIVHGVYLPSLTVALTSGALLWFRGFLPCWMPLLASVLVMAVDVHVGLGGSSEWIVFLVAAVIISAFGWHLDLALAANHGFWLNKMAMLCVTAFLLLRAVEWDLRGVLVVSLAVIAFSIYVRRPAGVSVGVLGGALWITYWFSLWDNLYLATAALAVCGLLAIVIGVRAHLVEDQLDRLLPSFLQRLRPKPRSDPLTFGF